MDYITDEPASITMKTLRLPTIFSTILIAAAMSACGGGSAPDSALSAAAPAIQSAAATHVVDLSVDPAAVGQTPAPDCAAENCQGLRIIDGNAEAWRLDAMRRAGS
jgi:hypothetical protein